MPGLDGLPNELRLEIAFQIRDWTTFQSFRHTDSTNLSLLTTLPCFKKVASRLDTRLDTEGRQGARNWLAKNVYSGLSPNAWPFVSGLLRYSGNPYVARTYPGRLRRSESHDTTTARSQLEMMMRQADWKSWRKLFIITLKERKDIVLPSHRDISRYMDKVWRRGRGTPFAILCDISNRQYDDHTYQDVHNFFFQGEGAIVQVLGRCYRFCNGGAGIYACGRHDKLCILGDNKNSFAASGIGKRVAVLFGMWVEHLFSLVPYWEWDTFKKLEAWVADLKARLLEVLEWMEYLLAIFEFVNCRSNCGKRT
ncbi:hypothetical protein BJ508DRAFT_327425 [Ascobolus immersus RN42]|uniref:Uncharacterized protein n=1 Tax=Ascobolus immersus RN42 TaxID=1160509 RepID=A0A3N4I868_ASCIM|nr:hypothetical protein BJ508DRAFT_327425 [Ascobolus immersus RN42]